MDIPRPGDKITVDGTEYIARPDEITVVPQCGDAWEDEESFGYGHECRLPKGHKGDHICVYQDDDEDYCRWRNWDDTPQP